MSKKNILFLTLGLISIIFIVVMIYGLLNAYNSYSFAKRTLDNLLNSDAEQSLIDMANVTVTLANDLFFRQIFALFLPTMFMISCFFISCESQQSIKDMSIKSDTELQNENRELAKQEMLKTLDIDISHCQCLQCFHQGKDFNKCHIYDIKKKGVLDNSFICSDLKKIIK